MADDSSDQPQLQISPQDRDIAIRTMIGEENSPEGQMGVASTMLNRLSSGQYGNSLSSIAMAPGQFESWSARGRQLQAISPDDPAYQQAAKIFDAVQSGNVSDYTGGATNFYAPRAQAALGRQPPAWATGTPVQLGQSLFFAPSGGSISYKAPAPKAIDDVTNRPDIIQSYLQQPASSNVTAPVNAKTGAPDLVQQYLASAPAATAAKVPAPSLPVGAPGPLAAAPNDSSAAALAKNVATGAIKGAADIPGFVGNISNLADYVGGRVDNFLTGNPTDQSIAETRAARASMANGSWLDRLVSATDPRNVFPSGPDISAPILQRTGEYVPTTELGRMGQAAAETAIGSLAPGMRPGVPANMLSRGALAGAATAGAAGTYGSDVTGDPLAGLAVAALPGTISKGFETASNRLIGTVQPETAQLAQLAVNRYGIPLNAGQISESPATRVAASASARLPFSGAGGAAAAQQSAFNRAVSSTFGQPADKVTPAVMQLAKTRLGNEFDNVASNTTIRVDPQFASDLTNTLADARTVLPSAEVSPLLKQVQNIYQTIDPATGEISGDSYQALTRKGTPLDRAMNSADPNVKFYAGQLRDALDDVMQRSAPPAVADQLSVARSQYKAMKTVEDLVEKSPTGDISPGLLMGATRNAYGNMAYGGGGDLGNLARIGQRFLKEPPSSGTSERMNAINLLTRFGSAGLGALGLGEAYAGNLPPAAQLASAAAVPVSFAANRAFGSYLRSPAVTRNLLSRSLALPQAPSSSQEFTNSMLPAYLNQSGATGASSAR